MGKRLWSVILFLLAAALGAEAQYFAVNGACSLGGQATVTQGIASSGTKPLRGGNTLNGTGVMASYPGCTVTVYQTGTLVPAPIYLTASGSAQSNPFTGNLTDGSWVFFASAGCYDVMISSGATQAGTMPNSKTFPGMCAGTGTGGGGGGTAGTTVTVNGTAAVPNQLNFTNTLLVPGGSSVVNFLLNGNTVGAYVTGGGGGGGSLPTTPQYDLFASSGAGAAQVSGIKGGAGFLQGQVITATGDVTSSPSPFPALPNASVEYFPQGAVFGGITVGAAHGLAAYFSHSSTSGAAPGYNNGGVMLGGGNSSGTNYQVYLDCESSPLGCDFKVPITQNGSAIGGGGGGGLPTIPQWNLFASSGAGAATDSGVAAETGFLRAQVIEASGASGAAPSGFTPPNGSIEYFPTGATYGGLNVGTLNGIAIHFSHSSKATGAPGNGGVALAGGNATGTASTYQIYVDCEQVGCDFKVPITYLGNGVGGGGGGGVTSINTVAGAFNFTGAGVSCSGTTCTFAGGGGGGSGTVNSGTLGHFTWYAATGTAVSSNANLDDSVTTAATITSQETVAAPGINVTGSGGIAMTGTGGTLPTPATNSGGIGIGPGNVPEFYSNGGAWTAIGSGSGGGGSGTVGTGVAGQFAVYNGATSVAGTPDLTDSSGSIIAANGAMQGTSLIATGAGPTSTATQAVFGVNSSGAATVSAGGGAARVIPGTLLINGANVGANPSSMNFNGTNANPPVCSPVAPTNGRCITFSQASGPNAVISAAIVGDGSANCLSGTGTYVPCGGAGGGTAVQVNGTAVGSTANFNASTTTPPLPTNGKIITFANSGTSVTAALVGDGSANCLSGTGAYVACGAGGGGSGTVGTGTVGQYAVYNGTTSVTGSTNFSDSGAEALLAPASVIAGTGSSTLPTTASGTSAIGFYTNSGQTFAAINGNGGATYSLIPLVQYNGVTPNLLAGPYRSFNSACTAVTNGKCITVQAQASGGVGFSLVGDGSGNCLNGQGSYVACSGAAVVAPCTPADLTAFTAKTTICTLTLPATAKNYIFKCGIIWNFTGGSGSSVVTSGADLSTAPASTSYINETLWGSAGPTQGVAGPLLTTAGSNTLLTTTSLNLTDGRIYFLSYEGTINASVSGNTVTVWMALSGGTSPAGAVRAGSYCQVF